ncbi:heat stress transcription factor B-2a [Punica granatum]|uniref:HSF-type DNA-binding domain-containing protein n=2 Tax=Punica granatum TaxID=22663 RepID=A0A218WTU4_PUNGR|nr:heat stress transcription factor B-2a [Punica granatum]OWM75631.1 hypothetical protein CDL15_Pgr021796 [Punica granatum]PKI32919.1 hypothetical protein CRG98_046693 [Punica granatum]
MAPPPPPEQSREATSGESQRSIPTPFLTKTYQLVDDEATNDAVSWNGDGSTFIVWNTTVFARDLLPKYFKHNNFSSFVRQLNTYGFKKVIPERWEFSHDCFRRGEKQLLREIQRRKMPASPPTVTVVPAPSSAIPMASWPMKSPPGSRGDEQMISVHHEPPVVCGQNCAAELADENERLRRENMILSKELTQMKSLCSNIFSLMSSFVSGKPESNPLELLPGKRSEPEDAREREESPRLFGVPIGAKRAREDPLQRPCASGSGEIKPEPSDCHGEQWLRQHHQSHRTYNQRVYN